MRACSAHRTPQTLTGLMAQILTEPGGMTLLIVGTMLGALFALFTLCTTVIAFPLLLDRDVGAFVAVETSFRAVLNNPLPMLAWGVIVGAGPVPRLAAAVCRAGRWSSRSSAMPPGISIARWWSRPRPSGGRRA